MRLYNFKASNKNIEFILSNVSDISETRPLFGSSWGAYRATNENVKKFDGSVNYLFGGYNWPIFGRSYSICVKLDKKTKKADVTIEAHDSVLLDMLNELVDSDGLTIAEISKDKITKLISNISAEFMAVSDMSSRGNHFYPQ
jgi:hypothetical protein